MRRTDPSAETERLAPKWSLESRPATEMLACIESEVPEIAYTEAPPDCGFRSEPALQEPNATIPVPVSEIAELQPNSSPDDAPCTTALVHVTA